MTDYNGNIISKTKLDRLGEHRYRGPKYWKGNPGMMGVDMLLWFQNKNGDYQEIYKGCNKIK